MLNKLGLKAFLCTVVAWLVIATPAHCAIFNNEQIQGARVDRVPGLGPEVVDECKGAFYDVNNGRPVFKRTIDGKDYSLSRTSAWIDALRVICAVAALGDSFAQEELKCFLMVWYENRRREGLGAMIKFLCDLQDERLSEKDYTKNLGELQSLLAIDAAVTQGAQRYLSDFRSVLSGKLSNHCARAWDECSIHNPSVQQCRSCNHRCMTAPEDDKYFYGAASLCSMAVIEYIQAGRWT